MKFSHQALWAVAVLAVGFLTACEPPPKKHKVFHPNAKEYHFKDGRYAMQTDSGDWLWYYLVTSGQNNTPVYEYYSSPVRSASGGFMAPVGGVWQKGTPPEAEEVQEAVEAQAVEVETAANGQMQEQTSEQIEAEPAEATSESSSDSSSSSSDSGGDGGGGGGGSD